MKKGEKVQKMSLSGIVADCWQQTMLANCTNYYKEINQNFLPELNQENNLMSSCECAYYRKYRQLSSNELNIEKYIEIELLTTNIDIENLSNIVQP